MSWFIVYYAKNNQLSVDILRYILSKHFKTCLLIFSISTVYRLLYSFHVVLWKAPLLSIGTSGLALFVSKEMVRVRFLAGKAAQEKQMSAYMYVCPSVSLFVCHFFLRKYIKQIMILHNCKAMKNSASNKH